MTINTSKRKPSVNALEGVLKDTKTIRARLDTHPHFVCLLPAAIKEIFISENGGYIEEEVNEAYKQIIASFSTSSYKLDISKEPLSNALNLTNRGLPTHTAIYNNGLLLGVLTSNFTNASEKVVKIVKDIINIDLAVGHVVGNVEERQLKSGFKYIQNNVIFRSPLSIKLANISEVYNIYNEVSANNMDKLIETYFISAEEGSGFIPKNNIKFLINALGNVFGVQFSRYIETGKISKTQIIAGFKSFADTYFNSKYKNKKFLTTNLDSTKIAQVEQQVINAINGIAEAHQEYYNRVVDSAIITKEFKESLAELRVVFTLPQTSKFNSGELQTVESNFSRVVTKFIKEQAMGFISSPALVDYIGAKIVESFEGKKTPNLNQTVSLFSDKLTQSTKTSVSSKRVKTATKVKPIQAPKLPTLKNALGQFTSLVSIERLIRASLQQKIRENMHSPRLNYRSGRLAESVKLDSLQRNPRSGAITAFLSYMKYPYATFEPGGRQGSPARSPSQLITTSVRELASKLVTERMKIVVA